MIELGGQGGRSGEREAIEHRKGSVRRGPGVIGRGFEKSVAKSIA